LAVAVLANAKEQLNLAIGSRGPFGGKAWQPKQRVLLSAPLAHWGTGELSPAILPTIQPLVVFCVSLVFAPQAKWSGGKAAVATQLPPACFSNAIWLPTKPAITVWLGFLSREKSEPTHCLPATLPDRFQAANARFP
jgi:hypothetical protein